MSLRRYWIVDCDHPNHHEVMNQGAEPEGAPDAQYPGMWKRRQVLADLKEQGWIVRSRKRICPSCLVWDAEQELCPTCRHTWEKHSGDPNYGGHFCHSWTDDGGCGCRAEREAPSAC